MNENLSIKKGDTKSPLYNGSFYDDSPTLIVNVSRPEMPGSCVNFGQREVDADADSTLSVDYNSMGDWIDASVEVFEKGQYDAADLDQQSFYNQTNLEASNSQSLGFSSADLSSKCSVTTSGDVPPGSSTVTTVCTNSTFSGDWIQNEVSLLGSRKVVLSSVTVFPSCTVPVRMSLWRTRGAMSI